MVASVDGPPESGPLALHREYALTDAAVDHRAGDDRVQSSVFNPRVKVYHAASSSPGHHREPDGELNFRLMEPRRRDHVEKKERHCEQCRLVKTLNRMLLAMGRLLRTAGQRHVSAAEQEH